MTLALAIIGLALSGGSVLIIVPVILGAIAAEIGLACLLKDLFDKKIEPYSCDDGYKLGRKISTSKQHLEHMIEEKINNQVDGQKAKFIHNYIMTRINDLYRDSN
ncbi:MAG: hypothetical protein S4CHLAM20_05230 [Chlamydiia bacterium]|nr:hypothetical protein [Chlamydiia bacterium]